MALGATVAFIGRPLAWGLHYGAKEGVTQLVSMLNDEFKIAMCLTDTMDVASITEE
jgi:4-hydroxymandelate oxidase